MADAPWQCPQCGTINEPVANSCRTCGRWPSLFDLERGAIPDASVDDRDTTWSRPTTASTMEVKPFEPETFETEQVELEPMAVEPAGTEPAQEAEDDERPSGRGRLLRSLIVPLAFAIYILISILFGDRGE